MKEIPMIQHLTFKMRKYSNVTFVHTKQNQKMVLKSTKQRNILTHANAVTELLLTKLTIPIISQNVTAHTVTMILP